MTGKLSILALAGAGALLAGPLSEAGPIPATGPATRPGAKVGQARGAARPAPKVRIDRQRRQLVIPAAVQLRQGALEFLLCVKGAKDHETLLVTQVPPSALHAGLLALGLMPGRPGRWTTPPGGEPVFEPPQGARVEIALRYKDAKGKRREAPATEWMLTSEKRKPTELKWVFVGSGFLDNGRYWADVEGLHISVANFPASVIDVPFKSTAEDAFLEFAADPKTVPPKGTPVDVVITVPKGQENAPVARIGFTIDAFGRIELDGRPIAPEEVGPAVKKFLARHAKGMAEVRVDPRAMVYDQDRLKTILADAGLTDVTFHTRRPESEILPRTPEQAAKAIDWWKRQFAQADRLIIDPAEDAEAVLKHVARRRRQLEDLSELWGDYAARLRALLDAHRRKAPPSGQDRP